MCTNRCGEPSGDGCVVARLEKRDAGGHIARIHGLAARRIARDQREVPRVAHGARTGQQLRVARDAARAAVRRLDEDETRRCARARARTHVHGADAMKNRESPFMGVFGQDL